MNYYKFVGTKTITFDHNTTSKNIDTSIPEILPTLTTYSSQFRILDFRVYCQIQSLIQSSLTYSRIEETRLQQQEKERELIAKNEHIEINYELDGNLILSSHALGSLMPYNYLISQDLPLSPSQSLRIYLRDKGYGLLTVGDLVSVAMPYELILIGE